MKKILGGVGLAGLIVLGTAYSAAAKQIDLYTRFIDLY